MGLSNSKNRKLHFKQLLFKTTPPFPFLKLPTLAIGEVLKEMDRLEIIQLSFASKRTRNILELSMKRHLSRNEYKLHIGRDTFYYGFGMILYCGESLPLRISFLTKNDRHVEFRENSNLPKIYVKLDGTTVSVKINSKKCIITAYYDDPTTGVKPFLQYFCRIFNPMISMNFAKENDLLITGVLDVMKKEKARIDIVRYLGESPSHCLYQNLLELPCKILNLSSSPDSEFRYQPSDEPIKFVELNVYQANWVIGLDDFLHCKSVYLRDASLDIQDIKKFLKKWIDSDSPLEYAYVSSNLCVLLDLKKIVEELLVTPMNRARIDNKTFDFEDGKCFGLKRSNGENAMIYQLDQKSFIIQTPASQRSPFTRVF